MKWNHIMHLQPEHNSLIIQIDRPYTEHSTIGMRRYHQTCTFKELLEYSLENNINFPDFWWIYAKDFDWPEDKDFSVFSVNALTSSENLDKKCKSV